MKGNPQEGKHCVWGNEMWVDTWDISLWPQYICPPMRLVQIIIFARSYGMRLVQLVQWTDDWLDSRKLVRSTTVLYNFAHHNCLSNNFEQINIWA